MLRVGKISSPFVLAAIPFNFSSQDGSVINKPRLYEDQDPMERIKRIFQYDGNYISKELRFSADLALGGFIIGTIIGGFKNTRGLVQNFIEANQATKFINKYDAQQRIQSMLFIQFVKGGIFGAKLGLFCGLFGLSVSMMKVYRNSPSIVDYIAGGTLTGSLFRLNLGIKGATAGAIVGGALGTLAGAYAMVISKLTGITTDEMQYIRNEWISQNKEKYEQRMKDSTESQEEVPKI